MKYCIIGAGISGLSTAYYLRKKYPEAQITIIEKSSQPGGLGSWTKMNGYYIEPYYHHFFESDKLIKQLSDEFGIANELYFKKATSAYFYDEGIVNLSGPLDLLFFKKLNLIDRIRVILSMAYLKLLPDGTLLDVYTVKEWMEKWIGKHAYSILWEPLMQGKFEMYADDISMSWMWGRIHDRTIKLGYFTGGVRVFLLAMEDWLFKNNVEIQYETVVLDIQKKGKAFTVLTDKNTSDYDKLIFTTISPIFARLTKNIFGKTYLSKLSQIKHIGTVCLLLRLNNKVQNNYWLNMCSKKTPYLISVEHTNFADLLDYKNDTVFYLAKYSDPNGTFYNQTDEYYLAEAVKTLKLLNNSFKKEDILEYKLSRVPASQTLFTKGYVSIKPEIQTPNEHVYIINIDQTFPHDRNLNMGIYLADQLARIL